MNVACSSATFAIQAAADMIRSGSAKTILIVDPEICSGHLDFKDRDCHFIFGDVCTAMILERKDLSQSNNCFEILSTKCITQFSNNIRNNFGFLNNAKKSSPLDRDLLFMQQGRKVFKEVVPMVSQLIIDHLSDEKIKTNEIKRLWLHQANKSMNDFIGKKVLGRVPENHEQLHVNCHLLMMSLVLPRRLKEKQLQIGPTSHPQMGPKQIKWAPKGPHFIWGHLEPILFV